MTMRPTPYVEDRGSRLAGFGSVILAGMVILLFGMGTAMAQGERPLMPPA